MRKFLVLAAGAALMSAPAVAQQQSGLVNVNIADVAVDIADVLDVNVQDVLNIGSIQVPVGIAANVCPNIGANVLAQAAQRGEANCTASNSSTALAKVVQRKLNANNQ